MESIRLLFLSGFFGTLASLVFWIVRRGALQDWWLQNFVWPSAWARYFGQEFKMSFLLDKLVPWTNINAVPIDWPFYVVSPLCCVILFSGCLHIALANRGKSLGFVSKFILSSNVDGLVILCCVSLASWLQYYPIPGIGHLWWSITPGIGALVWASSAVIGKFAQTISDQFFHKTRFQIRPHWVWAVVIALLAGGPICRRVADAYDLLFLPVAAVQGHNAFTGLRIHPFKARYLENVESLVNDVVNSSPEPHYVYVDGPEAMYTTFVRNARGFHPVWITVYPQMIEAIYPEYPKQLNEFVRDKEPIILFTGVLDAETFKKYPGYAVAGAVKGRDSDENSPIKGVNLATMKDLFILRKSKPR